MKFQYLKKKFQDSQFDVMEDRLGERMSYQREKLSKIFRNSKI